MAAPATGGGGGGGFSDLRTRVIAGLALAAIGLAAVAWGGWAFALLVAAAAGAMAWELRRMTAGRFDAVGWLAAAACAGACILTQATLMRWGLAWAALCIAPMALMLRGAAPAERLVMLGGAAYVAVASSALIGLRDDPLYGDEAVLWVILTVVATDVGAYFGGRLIGGPKLWPRVSPKKTWAGLLGGAGLAVVAGAGFSAFTTGTLVHEVAAVSALMAVLSQMGDLLESAVKRRFGVKDSSSLIPGHGGVLDRTDGLLAAALVAGVVTFLRGKSVFIW